ncbi:tetratricopeptide repeat protein [Niastella sp. MAH-29]|uniref:Tetratricopeptide repeat protein n=2 Tax=Chitinophagaceae TaxID=563835 RepID=A0ABS3YND9_9BACT|nr:tetratricopeptide repeat protein [Niastella soli]
MRKGNQNKWIWIIVCVPVVGALIYIFTEMVSGRQLNNVTTGVSSIFNPGGSIRKLEEQLRFSDTFHNRVALADAYLAAGQTKEAISLYEQSLTGVFTENEHVLKQLILAYANVGRFAEMLPLARKMYSSPQFARSKAHLLYAIALEETGNKEQAEKEFKTMNGRFAYFEARYHYALFLLRGGREEEARQVLDTMIYEGRHLSSRERRGNQLWINKAKEEARKMNVVSK